MTMLTSRTTVTWANPDPATVPELRTETPGPRSRALHERMERHARPALTSMVQLHPVAYERGQGVVLVDVDGNRYLDFSSGIAIANLGHAHPRIAEAIGRAAAGLDNVHDFATPAKVAALEALAEVTPPGLELFTFFSSGTEAVEAAMRIARAATGRTAFVGLYDDYHGRTGGSASLSSVRPSNGPRDPGAFLVPNGHRYHCTHCATSAACDLRCVTSVERAVAQHAPGQLAGVVFEPVTNAGGAVLHEPGYVAGLADVVRRNGGLVIADEVATGMGRTGRWFGCDHHDVVPDVMALGKGLGNGFPVSAVAVSRELAGELGAAFPSTSYGGNPMAMAAVVEVIAVLREEDLVAHCADLGEHALATLRALQARHPLVGEVRGRGALLAVELVTDHETRRPHPLAGNRVVQEAFRRGLALATAGHILRLTPPIVMAPELFDKGVEILDEALTAVELELDR